MKRLFFPVIVLTTVVAFALRPPAGKPFRVHLAPLATFPTQISAFRAVSDNNQLLLSEPATDGSIGLDRVYTDDQGTRFDVYIAPQMLGQHVPATCLNYAGDSVLALSRRSLPGNPEIIVNQISVQPPGPVPTRTCLYYWKTADGSYAPAPKQSVGEMAWFWLSQNHAGVLVEICTEQAGSSTLGLMETFARASYPEAARLYPFIFGTNRP